MRIFEIRKLDESNLEVGAAQTPNVNVLIGNVDLRGGADFGDAEAPFLVEISADLSVKNAGEYAFQVRANSPRELLVGKKSVVRSQSYASNPAEGVISLKRGRHRLLLRTGSRGNDAHLHLQWKPPGERRWTAIPEKSFSTEAGITQVVSPGHKRLKGELLPGHGAALDALHPSFDLVTIRPQGFEPQVGAMAMLPDGRLAVATFEPNMAGFSKAVLTEAAHEIHALTGIEGDPSQVQVRRIASGLIEPLGLCVVDGNLYVAQKHEITRLLDKDGDGFLETHETLASGWISDNYHHFTYGLLHRDGWLYAALTVAIDWGQKEYQGSDTIGKNAPNPPARGTVLRVNIKTEEIEYLVGGLRTPSGIGWGPNGDLFVSNSQGAWVPSSSLVHVQRGEFYGHYNHTSPYRKDRYRGHPSLFAEKRVTPPVITLPYGLAAVAPTDPLLIEEGIFKGQLWLGELTQGGIRRVALEKVNGRWQGATFRATQGLECGVHRLLRGPDGSIYVGGTGATANWAWNETRFGLQRLRWNGKVTFEMHSIRAKEDGLVVRFTKPVSKNMLEYTRGYSLRRWRYLPGPCYGGRKSGMRTLRVTAAEASSDGLEVRLRIEKWEPGGVVHLSTSPTSLAGDPIWSSEAWYTLTQIPGQLATEDETPPVSVEPGFEPVFTNGFAGWVMEGDSHNRGWSYDFGTLRHDAQKIASGNWLRLKRPLGHFDLRFEYQASKAADTGVLLLAPDGKDGWKVLARHRLPVTSADQWLQFRLNDLSLPIGGAIAIEDSSRTGKKNFVEYRRMFVRDLP